MLEPTLSSQLGAFLARLSYSDLSESQVSKLKLYFLDWLGSAIAGKGGEPIQIILGVIHELGGAPQSTIIPSQTSSNCLLAALANGASSHMVEMDDLHRESILHPATAIIPAVFALAEREKASGAELLLAIGVGYEAATGWLLASARVTTDSAIPRLLVEHLAPQPAPLGCSAWMRSRPFRPMGARSRTPCSDRASSLVA